MVGIIRVEMGAYRPTEVSVPPKCVQDWGLFFVLFDLVTYVTLVFAVPTWVVWLVIAVTKIDAAHPHRIVRTPQVRSRL